MSDKTPTTENLYPQPIKKRNDLAIELISGSVGGATQVLIGQVSLGPPKIGIAVLRRLLLTRHSLWTL